MIEKLKNNPLYKSKDELDIKRNVDVNILVNEIMYKNLNFYLDSVNMTFSEFVNEQIKLFISKRYKVEQRKREFKDNKKIKIVYE